MVEEGLITKEEALLRVDAEQLNQLLFPIFDIKDLESAKKDGRVIANGLNAGPGAASGKVVFNEEDAVKAKERGEKVISTRLETSPEEIDGMNAGEGILPAGGGRSCTGARVDSGRGK